MRKASGIGRLAASVGGIVALTAHLVYSMGSGGAAVPNFFSYFTMQSAIAAVILWGAGGIIALRNGSDPSWLVTARLLATTYQLVSGVVYTVIVAESVSRGFPIHVPVSTQVLHYWMPAFALLDWLFAPGRVRAHWRILNAVLVFPLVWGAFTMLRGREVGWYPYFFLDPYQVSGPAEFVAYSAVVLTFIVLVAAALILSDAFMPRSTGTELLARLGGKKRLQAEPRPLDDLVVVQLGEGDGSLGADKSHEDR